MTTKSLDEIFRDDLNDPEFVATYLQVSLEEDGVDGLTDALQYVAHVRAMAGNALPEPSFRNIYETLEKLGFDFQIVARSNAQGIKLAHIK